VPALRRKEIVMLVRKAIVRFVRIVATPPGEAPEEVRRAWVGLELPLTGRQKGPRTMATSGVLTGPRTFWGRLWVILTGRTKNEYGYVVDAPRSLFLLAESAPWAAQWWRECAPHTWMPGRSFLFPAEVCVEITDHDVARSAALRRPSSEGFFPAGPPGVTREPDRRPPGEGL
jgi:hypothetical protein